MKNINGIFAVILLSSLVLVSCSKDNSAEEALEGTFLSFNTNTKGSSSVLYSKWLPSQFPNSSQNSSEFFNLPLIKNSQFDPTRDAILVYGRRNNTFPLPTTLPQDAESYTIELLHGVNGTTVRIRVTSLLLDPLQDIFFNPGFNATFRVVIVPGEKLLPLSLSSKTVGELQNIPYETLASQFSINE